MELMDTSAVARRAVAVGYDFGARAAELPLSPGRLPEMAPALGSGRCRTPRALRPTGEGLPGSGRCKRRPGHRGVEPAPMSAGAEEGERTYPGRLLG